MKIVLSSLLFLSTAYVYFESIKQTLWYLSVMSSPLSNFTFQRFTITFLVWLCIVTKDLICFWWDYHDWLCLLIFLLIAVTNLVAWWVSTCKICFSFSSSLYLSFSQGKVNLRKIPLTISQGIKTDKFLWSREKSWWGIRKLA